LDEVPAIRDELLSTQSRLSALSAREAQLLARRSVVEKMALTKALGRSPEDYMRLAIHSPKLMQHVVNTARRSQSDRALKAAVWENALKEIDHPEGELPNPEKLIKWMGDNQKSLKISLPREHIQALEDVVTVLGAVRRTPIPKGAADQTGLVGKYAEMTGGTLTQTGNRIFAIAGGRVSEKTVFLERGVAFFDKFTKRQRNALMQEALMNEKLAMQIKNTMATSKGLEFSPENYGRYQSWLYALGVTNSGNSQDQP
jgi:hypothetical protein